MHLIQLGILLQSLAGCVMLFAKGIAAAAAASFKDTHTMLKAVRAELYESTDYVL